MIPISDGELIQGEIDGENPAQVSIALRKRLAEEPALQRRFQALQRAARAVTQLPWVEAPEGLAADVMRQLRRRSTPSRQGGLTGLGRVVFARPVLAYGSALAAGLLLGAFLFGPGELLRRTGSEAGLTGTALPRATIAQPPASDLLQLAEGPLRARVLWRPTADGVRVELAIEAPGPVDGALRFDAGRLRPRAVELAEDSEGEAVLGPGRVELRRVRKGVYTIVLLGSPSQAAGGVSVRLESQGRVVEGRIGSNPAGGTEG